jgi:GT2 family glycosyltransferase
MPFMNNKNSLASVYNLAINRAKAHNHDALILVHDDIIFEHDPIPKLSRLFDQFDVVGVAGASNVNLQSPALWHIMGQGHLHGAVAHGDNEAKWMTAFGKYPNRAVMIDGVFMALNRAAIEQASFDESNPAGFHFYDLDFSLSCHKMGLRVGVGDIMITHNSPGLREFTEDWKAGERWFLNKYES